MEDLKSEIIKEFNNSQFKTYILDTINELRPSKKKTIYSNKYYLENIIYMLNDLCRWRALKIIDKDKSKYHWKTIENKFREWSKLNIFEIAYNKNVIRSCSK